MNRKMFGRDRIINERHLFHGTSQDVVDGICKHNFDPRVCGKHATMFGQGSYFAKKASYSHNFSKKSSKGVHFMFLAKVLTGRYTMGSHGMRRPPPVNPGSVTSDLYDSCVDNFFEPQIFVIFNDDQSYPYFVIQYEEVSNTVSIWKILVLLNYLIWTQSSICSRFWMGGTEWGTALDINRALLRPIFLSARKWNFFLRNTQVLKWPLIL